jgi:phage terminase large subunit-like protein
MPSKADPFEVAEQQGWASWIRTDADRKAVELGYYFDAPAAARVKDFFSRFLRHSKGKWARQPFELMDWQYNDVLGPIFGWKRPDGKRRFKWAYVEIPKKNGKSTMGAGIGLYMLVGDGEGGAEVYSAATKKDQADIVHSEAIRMVDKSPGLSKHLKLNRATKVISYLEQEAKYAALASDSAGTEGINPHCVIIDELHAWKDRTFWDTLRYGDVARDQPLMFVITTAGVFDVESVGWEQHEYARKVLAGDVDDLEYFSYIRGADPEDDVTDPAVHEKANPSYGVTIKPEEILKSANTALEKRSELNTFKRYRLNIWVQQLKLWLPVDKWDACECDIDWSDVQEPVVVGLDLSSKLDLTALALVGKYRDGYACRMEFFAPKERAYDRQKKDRVPYLQWSEDGYINLTEGNVVDYKAIRRRINEIGKTTDIAEVAFDPWNATQISTELGEEDGFTMVQMRQGYGSLSEPSKVLEACIANCTMYHEPNPVMRWMIGNVACKTDPAGNIKPDKENSSDKIDGPVALITALGRLIQQPEQMDVYSTRGVMMV